VVVVAARALVKIASAGRSFAIIAEDQGIVVMYWPTDLNDERRMMNDE
jgi:hypothetical protein